MVEQSMVGGTCLIYCDYTPPPDNCLVDAANDYSLEEYRNRPDDVIEFQFREMFRKQLGDRVKVYDVKRLLSPGRSASAWMPRSIPAKAARFTIGFC